MFTAMGARQIVATDLSDNKLEFAKIMGATDVINPIRENLEKSIIALTNQNGIEEFVKPVGSVFQTDNI